MANRDTQLGTHQEWPNKERDFTQLVPWDTHRCLMVPWSGGGVTPPNLKSPELTKAPRGSEEGDQPLLIVLSVGFGNPPLVGRRETLDNLGFWKTTHFQLKSPSYILVWSPKLLNGVTSQLKLQIPHVSTLSTFKQQVNANGMLTCLI